MVAPRRAVYKGRRKCSRTVALTARWSCGVACHAQGLPPWYRLGVASVTVLSGGSRNGGACGELVVENGRMDKDVWLRRIAVVLRMGMSKIENESSKADYPTLPDVGTVFDVCWEITRATVLGRWNQLRAF